MVNEPFDINSHKIVNFSLKVKLLNRTVTWLRVALSLTLFLLAHTFCEGQVAGQRPIPRDTLQRADTLKTRMDTVTTQKSDIETTILYSARDSINSSIDRKIVHLYGDAHITYGEIELSAEEITIDYDKSTLSADGKLDSLGRQVGYPIFVNGSEKYETKSIVYNFKTKRARISEVVTKQQEGFIHGRAVFKNEKDELLSIRNSYTTCNLAHPHYEIISSKAKAIPGDKMVAGPFYMQLNDVPLPLGFIFGIFPSPRKSSSGIIVPSYGEERNRGYFLRNGGYFFDINDYFKFQVTGDIYSLGSSALYFNANYKKRYHYNGAFNFSYTSNYTTSNVENKTKVNDFRLTWSHSPQTKGSSRFSASVNAATSTFNNNNFLGVNTNPTATRIDNTTRKLSSNISYSKTFGSKLALGINLKHNQDVTTGQVDLPLPDVSFNINNLYPFKNVSDGLFLQNLSMRYTLVGTNQITNNLGKIKKNDSVTDSIAPFNMQNLPTFINNGKKGVRHTLPLATSFKLLKFFTVTPSFNMEQLWYFEKLKWGVSSDGTKAVVKDTVKEFNTVTNYNTNISFTTRIYGTYFFKGNSSIKAIRHIINPSFGFTFQPDFGDPSYGYYQPLKLVSSKNVVYKSVHEGFVYGSSKFGQSSALSFGINNNIEMKVKNKNDTVARKIPLFNTLSIGSSYNFVLDSFRLAPFGMAANTNILNNKLNFNMSASLDPYKYVTLEHEKRVYEMRTSQYSWNDYTAPAGYTLISESGGIGRITSANLAMSTNLSPKGQKKDADTRDRIGKSNASDSDKKYLMQNPDAYIDFNVPWNLRLSYNVDYSRPVNSKETLTQSLRMNGDFSLTEKWKITFNTGYDFKNGELTQTLFTIARDLHCWELNVSWVPFGKYQSYNFYIGIKSSLLKDLRLNRARSFYDN